MLDIRQRTGYLFLSVTIGHLILISAQVNTRTGVPVLHAMTFGVMAELQRFASSSLGNVRGLWGGYVGLRRVRAENEALRQRIADLQVQLQQQRALAQRSAALEKLVGLRSQIGLPTTAARIMGSDATQYFRTVTIDKGSADGLRPDMPVIAPTGVVGRVVSPLGARAATVQLLIDRNAGAGDVVERSQAAGVVVGAAGEQGEALRMEYVSALADVKRGDAVVTSGIDGIFPKGFMLGTVESVERGAGQYKSIRVRPAVDFRAVDEVLVVLTPPAGTIERSEGTQ
jgi:rod shape-determining protein MreC